MSKGRQVVRQWKVLRVLEAARSGLTAEDIVEGLDERCVVRTVYRDLEQLEAAGFPIVNEQGRWRLQRVGSSWSLPVQPTDLLGLLVASQLLGTQPNSPFFQPVDSLRSKLMALLTPEARAWVGMLQRHVVAEEPGPSRSVVSHEVYDTLHFGIEQDEVLRIAYRKPGEAAREREIEPYMWWWNGGRQYVVARCVEDGMFKTFAVQRIESAVSAETSFERDPTFDPTRFTRLGFGVFHGEVHDVVVWFDASVAHLFDERTFHHSQRVEPAAGGVHVSFRAAGLPEIASWIAGFGGKARPVRPSGLVNAVRRIHQEGLVLPIGS